MTSADHSNAAFNESEFLAQDAISYGTKGKFAALSDQDHVGQAPGPVKNDPGPVLLQRAMSKGPGSTITAHGIHYTVSVRKRACCGPSVDKEILNGINGIFRPGMNAILGPTGSGKSSLLDVLAGRKDVRGLSGDLLIDGCPPPQNFKCMVGYVVQDDVVVGTLTVRENFHFSAALRLPSTISTEERKERVENVIQELGLTHCADTKVGNEFIRGISGGERKRCNIGMELIISPPVLFLDEPTTGLDANTANTVMLLLKQMAMKGRTIIFSIHQPRFSIYRLFDSLMLLSLGECVYHGPAQESLDFFSSVGFVCQAYNNPPDFFLDVISADPSIVSGEINDLIKSGVRKESPEEAGNEEMHKTLVSSYQQSSWHHRLTSELTPILDTHRQRVQTKTLQPLAPVDYATSFGTQFRHLSFRIVKTLIRNPQVSVMQVLVMVIFGLLVGAIYWDIGDSCKSGLQNRNGSFFFIVMNLVFANLDAVEIFIKERPIFIHENVSGYYRVSSYFLSKIVCDILPMRLLPVIAFTAIVYFMLGFRSDTEHFFVFLLCLFLVSISGSAICFFFSACVRIFAVANLLVALTFVFMMVYSGLLVNIASVPDWLEWIKWISIFRYGLEALSVNELKDMTFVNSTLEDMTSGGCPTGNQYMDAQGIAYETAWDLWQNHVALGAITIIMLFLAYLRMLFMNKLR